MGFPQCERCPYVRTGPPHICVTCAGATFEGVPIESCAICSQKLDDEGKCRNWLCNDPRRRIARISAIAYSSGALRRCIHRYKYESKTGWALIFGRLVLGWLARNARGADRPGLIVANPTFVGSPDGAAFAHTELVLEDAAREDVLRQWPIDAAIPHALIKTRATPKSAANSAAAKRAVAQELREALLLPERSRTEGRRILVYDDVATTGYQLNAVAGCLLDEGGATHVEALVLARAPWRPGPAATS